MGDSKFTKYPTCKSFAHKDIYGNILEVFNAYFGGFLSVLERRVKEQCKGEKQYREGKKWEITSSQDFKKIYL